MSHHSNAPADGRLPASGRPHTVNSGNPDTLHTARPTRAVHDAPPPSPSRFGSGSLARSRAIAASTSARTSPGAHNAETCGTGSA